MLLNQIEDPKSLKQLNIQQLGTLASEIRRFLIEKLSVTGGHLAPNLGVVELTIALHYLFDSPKDKFIWDVGHQSYVHKILTGRKDLFDTLRQYQGLSGFPKRDESVHDVWETGHSSTSLSAAMGMALSRDLKGENHKIIAVIGDGALTGGMAFEALNHIGHEKKNIIIVLNDNEMSIAPNVGALHNYLGKLRTDQHYVKAKEELEHLLKKIPAIGGKLAKTAERIKDSVKYLLVSGVLFEELGFTYLGPIDGHNIQVLLKSLAQAGKTAGPVLVHVVTKKGKGYAPAEEDSYKFHGISPYKIETGKETKKPGTPSYSSIFADTLIQLAEEDKRIVAITAAMPNGTGLNKFAERFPERMIDVGIAEQHATTMAGGLSIGGMKPVFAVYSTFLQRAYDQLVHDICRQNLNVVFAIDRAGLVGADGETHQGVFDIAYLRHLPNMVLMMPKDENELSKMVKTAIDYNDGPIAFRFPRGNASQVPKKENLKPIPIGKWEILTTGSDAAIIAIGPMVAVAMEAYGKLLREGIEVRVINGRFIKPLDEMVLCQLAEENIPILTVEEASLLGGFGSAVLEYYANQGFHHQIVKNIGIPDQYIQHGSVSQLREEIGLTTEMIIQQIKSVTLRKRQRAL
ncbi:1-deoxy-D-xylulose-5-phosphate synthase [Microaerobacter geothermalis]|uniref:1-deoxy-D-xylulose-5-phosphate synthase n=1 Tax=Microaerobacter geothermalis TaxID=674972 RepID=UPI001EFF90F5|nr:1-deoxy-D-xylulose-5-phosphate synthase [Microaerobacter geothermalis]MCF6094437.1 1-deoxy-D-xylulose-5-phosphate synthase [Microaerobacter geothermalis]